MAFKIDTATDYLGALSDLMDFVTNPSDVTVATADPGNTGNGTCSQPTAVDAAPTEDWTLTATSATNFTVVGSISGGQADATVGTPYSNSIVAFTITAGGTPFVSGDIFTFTVTQVMGVQKWVVNDWDTDFDGDGGSRLFLKGPGNTGTDEILVGIQTAKNDVTPWYNWILAGHTGYSAAETLFSQMGARIGDESYLPRMLLDDQPMKYWFMANGRRIMGVIRVGTIYAPFYLGFPLKYGVPDTYPYPLVIGGSAAYSGTADNRKWSSTWVGHRGCPDPYTNGYLNAASLMVLNGTWFSFGNYTSNAESSVVEGNCVWPGCYAEHTGPAYYANRMIFWGDPTPDGGHPLFPLVLCQDDIDDNIIGELEGMYLVHGDGVVAEDDLSYGGDTYKVFQNTFNTSPHNYFALKLE